MCQFSLIKNLLILNNFWLKINVCFFVRNFSLAADCKITCKFAGTKQYCIIILACASKCCTLCCDVWSSSLTLRSGLHTGDSEESEDLFRCFHHLSCQNRSSLAILSCIFESTLCKCFVISFRCFLFYLTSSFNLF